MNFSMKVQLALILASVTVFGFALANCTTEQKQTSKVVQETTTTNVSHETTTTAAVPQHDAVGWKEMDKDQRKKYMREVVLPKMRQTFAEFNSEEFGRINCKTCHGDGATNESFEMPNPKLPKLPGNTAGFQELMKKDSAMMMFMMKKVKPQMAELLGMPEMDPKTNPEGFGCGNCHTFKK